MTLAYEFAGLPPDGGDDDPSRDSQFERPRRPVVSRDPPRGPDADRELPARLRVGDTDAFDAVFRAHFALLAGYVRRFVDSSDTADDVAQEAFVQLWAQRARLTDAEDLTPLLRTIARRIARKQWRHLQMANDTLDVFAGAGESPGSATPSMSPDVALVQAEGHAQVRAALRAAFHALPPRTRLVATMHWVDQLPRQAIAVELGVSVRTVDAQIYSATQRVRAALALFRRERHPD